MHEGFALPVAGPVSRYIPASSDELDEIARQYKTTSEKE